jgi:hypothetical protein
MAAPGSPPRLDRVSIESLQRLDQALQTGSGPALLENLVLGPALNSRTPAEQIEFVSKALRDEISAEGLKVLSREGQFGPLTNVFPQEASAWAAQAGVRPEDCMAFRLERNGQRAEVVLARNPSLQPSASGLQASFRILRVNNVKQLAGASTANGRQ